MKLQKLYFSLELTQISFTFFQCDVTATPIQNHFQQKIDRAPLDHDGEENNYHAPNFIARLAQYFLPHAALWSGLMLGIFCKFCFKSVVIYKININNIFNVIVVFFYVLIIFTGDIGRHGTGPAYQHFSKIHKEVSQSNKQVNTVQIFLTFCLSIAAILNNDVP